MMFKKVCYISHFDVRKIYIIRKSWNISIKLTDECTFENIQCAETNEEHKCHTSNDLMYRDPVKMYKIDQHSILFVLNFFFFFGGG